MSDSHVLRRERCPSCGSRDNLARYSDGHAYCFGFGCEYFEPATDTPSAPLTTPKGKSMTLLDGEIAALPKRGITEETCRVWGYRKGTYSDGRPVQIAPYADSSGEIVAQKLRFADKGFKFIGEPKRVGLFGQHLWRDGGKMVVITEGEIDALSVSQLQGNKWPVVSVPNGAQGAAKSVAGALEWLLGFDKVVLMFDDDEPGRGAAKECAQVLPAGKAFIATIGAGIKDANEALTLGKGAKVIDAIWNAKEFRPDGIVGMDSVLSRATQRITQSPLSWPWPTLNRATYGRRRGELYGFAGGTGMGKTTTFKQVKAHILQTEDSPIGVFALEEATHHSAKTVAGVMDGVRYHVPGVDYEDAKLEATLRSMEGRVYFYDHFGGATYETVIEKMRYMRHAFGVRDFFLDHITALAATMGDDERKAIDRMMADLSALMLELDATLYFISHLATPEGKSHEEGGRVLERHFRGSRSIAYWAHYLFAIEGDKQKLGSPRLLRVLKDRFTGDANGLVIGLQYDRDTGRLVECELGAEGKDDDCPF